MSKIISSKYKLTIAQKHFKTIPRNESEDFSSLQTTLKMKCKRNMSGVFSAIVREASFCCRREHIQRPRLDIRQSVETLEHPELNERAPSIPSLRLSEPCRWKQFYSQRRRAPGKQGPPGHHVTKQSDPGAAQGMQGVLNTALAHSSVSSWDS